MRRCGYGWGSGWWAVMFVLLSAHLASAQEASSERPRSFICSARYDSRIKMLYRSSVFQATATDKAIVEAWEQYLHKTFSSQAPNMAGVVCQVVNPDPSSQAYALTMIDQQAQANQQQVIHLEW